MSRGVLARGFLSGGLCPGGLCPGGLCPGVYVRGFLSGGFLSWNRSVKSMSVRNSFCSLQLLPKHVVQTNRNKANCVKSSLSFLCAIAHIF